MNRFLTTTDTGADTRRIPGWDLTSRSRPVGLVYWTQRTNQLCDWSVGDFDAAAVDAHLAAAKALGADAWLFDLEAPAGGQPTPATLFKLLGHVRAASRMTLLFYGAPYTESAAGLYASCGGVLLPVGQIMRPDDLAGHLEAIREWSNKLTMAHRTLPRYYVMQDTYNWGELQGAAAEVNDPGMDPYIAAKWWLDIPQRDCRAILDVNDYLHNNVVVFQPALMPNPWQSGIRPLYVELLR